MNDRLFQFQYSYERDLVRIPLKISIGASGAPTIVNGKGLVSITRNSAGKYTLVLKSKFNVLLALDAMFVSGSSAPAAPSINIDTDTISTNANLVIQCRNLSAAATDPASGEIMMLELVLRRAST